MTRHRCIAPLLLTLVLLTAGCGDEPARPIAQGEAAATLTIDYPIDLSVFPPDLVAPRLRWKDATEGVNAWLVVVEPEDGEALLREVVPGEPPPIGVIDPACIARTNSLPARPGPFERSWRIPDELWAQVKQGTHQRWAKITVICEATYRITPRPTWCAAPWG